MGGINSPQTTYYAHNITLYINFTQPIIPLNSNRFPLIEIFFKSKS